MRWMLIALITLTMACGGGGGEGEQGEDTPCVGDSVFDADPAALDTVQDIDPEAAPQDTEPEPEPAPLLELLKPAIPLMPDAQEAIALAPAWVQADLRIAFDHMYANEQDEMAALLLGLDDPRLIDEVAFMLAHLSPEILVNIDFYPQLIVEVAAAIYAVDEVLDYVELVDVGEAGVDPDFHTVARYRVDVEGEIEEREIDRYTYYWYVVHPRLEDEWPFYIDGWTACWEQDRQCPVSPEEGQFWRRFLWDGAIEAFGGLCPAWHTCPLLVDYLTVPDVLWRHQHNTIEDNGAIGQVTQFVLDALDFGATGERSVQPNRIYALINGNCGEHADLTAAAARIGLIPTRNVGAYVNDHTWNEFWDGEWFQWEPIGSTIGHKAYYGANVYACTTSRGDSWVTFQTHACGDAFDLELTLTDSDDQPLDGARILIFGLKDDGYWYYTTELTTDLNGFAWVALGRDHDYAVKIITTIGELPPEENSIAPVIQGGVPEEEPLVEKTIKFETALPEPPAATEADLAGDAAPEMRLSVDLAPGSTRMPGISISYGTTFHVQDGPGKVQWFITDELGYEQFQADGTITGYLFDPVTEESSTTVDLPRDRAWYLVATNRNQQTAIVTGHLRLLLEPAEGTTWDTEAIELSTPYELAPSEHLCVRINQ